MIEKTTPTSSKLALFKEVKVQASIVSGMVGVMWVEEIVDFVLGGFLNRFGIVPRSLFGLLGIPVAPFLHADFGHLAANTLPLIVLSFLIMLRRKRDLLVVSVLSTLVGGLGAWLLGASNSVHIGASILVFGYLGYLLSRGIFERKFWPIVGSIAVFFLYGGALHGIFPGDAGISWQGHLFGLLGGVLSGRLLSQGSDRRIAVKPATAGAVPAGARLGTRRPG